MNHSNHQQNWTEFNPKNEIKNQYPQTSEILQSPNNIPNGDFLETLDLNGSSPTSRTQSPNIFRQKENRNLPRLNLYQNTLQSLSSPTRNTNRRIMTNNQDTLMLNFNSSRDLNRNFNFDNYDNNLSMNSIVNNMHQTRPRTGSGAMVRPFRNGTPTSFDRKTKKDKKTNKDTLRTTKNINKINHWYALKIEGKVRNLSPNLWKFSHLTKLDMRDNKIRHIPEEINQLTSLMVLDVSLNKLKTIPRTIGDLLELRELNLSDNDIANLPNSVGRLFNLQQLYIENNRIDQVYMQMYRENNGVRDLLTYFYDAWIEQNFTDRYTNFIGEKPPREWRQIEDLSSYPKSPQPITVMTYNILSDKYATSQQYGYCPTWALSWNYRKDKLYDELQSYRPDIVCLQEIEKRVFNNDFKAFMETLGYDGIFSQKSRAKTMDVGQQEHVDGCAIFYNKEMFNPVMVSNFNK